MPRDNTIHPSVPYEHLSGSSSSLSSSKNSKPQTVKIKVKPTPTLEMGEHQPDDDCIEEIQEEEKSKRPDERAFFQQQLPGWEPVMTADWGCGIFLVMGIVALAIGIPLLVASNDLHEEFIHYGAQCEVAGTGELCENYFKDDANLGNICNCSVGFELTKDMKGKIYMYYSMNNFYQNHRQYAKSRDYLQLTGKFRSVRDRRADSVINKDCEPLRYYAGNATVDYLPFAPCGLIANSLFNDSISMYYEDLNEPVGLLKKNIAWDTDKKDIFNNPPGDPLVEAFNGTEKPPNWQKAPWELDEDPENNGYENEDFIVWMRTSVFPYFRKLYRRVDHVGSFEDGLPAGQYRLDVEYAFPTHLHEGDKTIVLTNLSWAGGKNPFLGIMAIAVGVWCLILSIVFFFLHMYTKDWDKELLEQAKKQVRQGIDNPVMSSAHGSVGRGNKVFDEQLTPDAWRRKISIKASRSNLRAVGSKDELVASAYDHH